MCNKNVTNKKAIIATHYLVYGAPQALREYLISKNVEKLVFIGHPLHINENKSYVELIKKNVTLSKKNIGFRTRFSLVNYIIEILLNLKTFIFSRDKYDIFIGVDSLNAFSGIILKKLGITKKVIFYTIDYVPKRFENCFLNEIYHQLDRFCVYYSDETWNVSYRIADAREELRGMNKTRYNKQRTVPIGVWADRIKIIPFDQIKKHQLLFVGNLLEKQGVQYVLKSIPSISKAIPDFHFLIVGDGDYSGELKELVNKLKIEKYVTFTGWIKNRSKLDEIMSDSALAVALYDKNKDTFTYYADPTKIKDYLSAGLPILLTDVPHNAKEIEEKGCGKIITTDPDVISETIIEILEDENCLKNYRKNALNYIKQFKWETIFSKSLFSNDKK